MYITKVILVKQKLYTKFVIFNLLLKKKFKLNTKAVFNKKVFSLYIKNFFIIPVFYLFRGKVYKVFKILCFVYFILLLREYIKYNCLYAYFLIFLIPLLFSVYLIL